MAIEPLDLRDYKGDLIYNRHIIYEPINSIQGGKYVTTYKLLDSQLYELDEFIENCLSRPEKKLLN